MARINALEAVMKSAVFMMLLFIAGLVGAIVSRPAWPTAAQCERHCATAGARVGGFHPLSDGRGMCTCSGRRCAR